MNNEEDNEQYIIARVNLSNYDYIFSDNEVDLKKKNIIFGNNGTGKSSLVKAIQELTDVDVKVYKGFNNYINKNEDLNAITLGEKNKNIDEKIHTLNKKKENLVNERNNKNAELSSKKNKKEEASKKFSNCGSKIASELKVDHTSIFSTNFNITKLKK